MSDDLSFGETLRARRTALAENAPAFSLRQVAGRIGLEPSYLRKIERGEESPPGEQTIRRLAGELGENPDALLALAGKVSSDLLEIIRERPFVVAELLRALRCLAAKFAMATGEQSGRLFPEPRAGLGSPAYENTP